MTEYKPVSHKQHAENRDYLISLLFKDETIAPEKPEVLNSSSGIATMLPNSPNPFTGSTTLNYQLNEDAVVNITLCDYTGRIIKTFAQGPQTEGLHQLLITADNISPGIYFCSISANGSLGNTQKIILQ